MTKIEKDKVLVEWHDAKFCSVTHDEEAILAFKMARFQSLGCSKQEFLYGHNGIYIYMFLPKPTSPRDIDKLSPEG